jgi:hypothetical protein
MTIISKVGVGGTEACYQVVTKSCRLIWLTNSALVYEPKRGGRIAGPQPMSTAVHRSPYKLWRSNSIYYQYACNKALYVLVAGYTFPLSTHRARKRTFFSFLLIFLLPVWQVKTLPTLTCSRCLHLSIAIETVLGLVAFLYTFFSLSDRRERGGGTVAAFFHNF